MHGETVKHVEVNVVVTNMELWAEEQFRTIPVRYSATLRSQKILLSNIKQEIWQLCVNFCWLTVPGRQLANRWRNSGERERIKGAPH